MRFTRIAGTSTRMYALSEAGNIYYLKNKDVWVPMIRVKDSEPIPPEVPSWDTDGQPLNKEAEEVDKKTVKK